MGRVLVIDDDDTIRSLLTEMLGKMGHETASASTLGEGFETLSRQVFDLVFLDVNLPDGDGIRELPRIKASEGEPEVVIITGEGDPEGASLAIRSGAWDYVEKPIKLAKIDLPLRRALQCRTDKVTEHPVVLFERDEVVGCASAVERCLREAAQAAAVDSGVLITGETGTGKEVFAHLVHRNSRRREKNFVVVDCAALPETLVESTLFGHRRGAFTGADRDREGLVKMADGGTLFLDEVAELPPAVQKSFLRVLQEKRFRPVGGREEVASDFRLIAATNRDIEEMSAKGLFRQDLLYRIRSLSISLPPLRERAEDILELARHFMNRFCDLRGEGTKGFAPEFQEVLRAYDWPGNVRELAGVIESILTAAGAAPILYPDHLPVYVRATLAKASVKGAEDRSGAEGPPAALKGELETYREHRRKALEGIEERYLRELVRSTEWNISEASRTSGLSRPRLYSLLKKHGISRGA